MFAGDVTERSKIVRRFLQEAVHPVVFYPQIPPRNLFFYSSIRRTFLEERQRISNPNEWTRDPCLRMGRPLGGLASPKCGAKMQPWSATCHSLLMKRN